MVSRPFRAAFPVLAMVLAFVPCLWLLSLKKYKVFAVMSLLLVLGLSFDIPAMHPFIMRLPSAVTLCLAIFRYMLPGFAMFMVIASSHSVSDFINAMRQIHLPMTFIISLSVVFRFVPTVHAERRSIRQAVRIRGMDGFYTLRHPLKKLAYEAIPLLTCCARIGDELSMASLCRGLSVTRPRTLRARDRLTTADWSLIVFSLLLLAGWIFALITQKGDGYALFSRSL